MTLCRQLPAAPSAPAVNAACYKSQSIPQQTLAAFETFFAKLSAKHGSWSEGRVSFL